MMKVDIMTTIQETYDMNIVCEIILVWMHCYDMWTSAGFQVMTLPKTE